MSDSPSEALVAALDPVSLEAEVVRLREECRGLLVELERRWRRAIAIPRRVGEAPRRLVRVARRHPAIAFASLAILVGAALLLGRQLRARR
jgi:hypothetical protein